MAATAAIADSNKNMETKTWSRGAYSISTDASLIRSEELAAVFASTDFYWAKALPEDAMKQMLSNSLCFGVYEEVQHSSLEQIKGTSTSFVGFARCVTDYVTFAYLTDVWIKATHRGEGLGKWLIQCVNEVVQEWPHLRRTLLFTADWERSVPFYEQNLNMTLLQSSHGNGLAVMECKGKGHPSYGSTGSSYN